MIGQYAEVPGHPWVLFSSIERSDIDKQLAPMRTILLTISFIVSIILAGVLVSFGSRTVLLSIEERERMAREANERRKEIEKLMNDLKNASDSKAAFLFNISNKMEGSINAIIRLSSLISQDKEISENVRENMGRINDSGVMLYEVVNDIVDSLKLETEKLQIRPDKYILPNLIYDMTVNYAMSVENKSVQYRLVVGENLPLQLTGDEVRIRYIGQHVLDNSFKITTKGTIAVNITCRKKDGYVWLIIKISNTGIGMTQDEAEGLFAGYGRVDAEGKPYQGASVLGLSICRQMAELMKGTLTVASVENKGTVFTLCVPQKLLSEETIGKETAEKLMKFQYTKN
jgi:signal transduction histidine kinase